MSKDKLYNGWANWETWNVALWLSNDEALYIFAKDYRKQGYEALAEALREAGITETPDRCAYNDSALDIAALDEMLGEL